MPNEVKTAMIKWNRDDVKSAGQRKTLDGLRAVDNQGLQGLPHAYKPGTGKWEWKELLPPQDDSDSMWPTLPKTFVNRPTLSEHDAYTLSSVAYPGKCLTLNTDNTDVFAMKSDGGISRQWGFQLRAGDGRNFPGNGFQIRSKYNNQCLGNDGDRNAVKGMRWFNDLTQTVWTQLAKGGRAYLAVCNTTATGTTTSTCSYACGFRARKGSQREPKVHSQVTACCRWSGCAGQSERSQDKLKAVNLVQCVEPFF
ncbi:unnamed protein product [Symbiodinium sp. CCMP2456]|nr:unnamed protein product [Symbiodinium sp. CCMP2456]